MTWQPTLNRIGAGPNGKGFTGARISRDRSRLLGRCASASPITSQSSRETLRKHHGKMVEMTRLLSSAAAWFRENDCFEQVYPVERIVLAPSLPRVDEISAS